MLFGLSIKGKHTSDSATSVPYMSASATSAAAAAFVAAAAMSVGFYKLQQPTQQWLERKINENPQ